jgi:hypothetical protein
MACGNYRFPVVRGNSIAEILSENPVLRQIAAGGNK